MRTMNIQIQRPPAKSRQRGFLLVEVMVAMIILAIGFLGIVKLQHVTKAANAQSVQRSIAADLADNLVERIRANTFGITGYFPSEYSELTGSSSEPTPNCTSGSQCTPTQLAAYDLWEWQMQLTGGLDTVSGASTSGLANPVVCLRRPATVGAGIYHIAIAWHSQSRLENQAIAANATASNCGTGDNNYDATGSDDNEYRRIHWQTVYLDV